MSDPHWRAVLQGSLYRHRTDPTSRYLQLATVDASACPRNRTVVFRGFLEGSDMIQFAVDSRSEKILQIMTNPQAQVCWYFRKTREQFRITGFLLPILAPELMDPDHQALALRYKQDRDRMWWQMSERGRLLWYWPPPKAERGDPDQYLTPSQIPDSLDPPSTFVLLLLDPIEVDHLQLKGDQTYPQLRHLFTRQGSQWGCQVVNP